MDERKLFSRNHRPCRRFTVRGCLLLDCLNFELCPSRPIIDIALLIFHLVLGSFTHDGVDISMAKKSKNHDFGLESDSLNISLVMDFNLERFPRGDYLQFCPRRETLTNFATYSGVIFLFAEGRLRVCQSQPGPAVESYKQAMDVQSEYRQLQYIALWEQVSASPNRNLCGSERTLSIEYLLSIPV